MEIWTGHLKMFGRILFKIDFIVWKYEYECPYMLKQGMFKIDFIVWK